MAFIKQFNAQTIDYMDELPLRTKLTVYSDNSFDFTYKSPPSTWFFKKASGIEKGNSAGEIVGTIHIKQIYAIAEIKKAEGGIMERTSLESVCRSLVASATNMGLTVSYEKD